MTARLAPAAPPVDPADLAPPLWQAEPSGGWTWVSPQWQMLTGQDAGASAGWGWLDAILADDRAAVRAAWRDAAAAPAVEVRADVQTVAGDVRCYRHCAVADPAGSGWIGVSMRDDTIRLRERQRRLLAEWQHRNRNMLSTIRSLVRHGAETAVDVADFAAHLEGRLGAVSRAQIVESSEPPCGADFRALLADELAALATREGGRLQLDGPSVAIPPGLVQPVVLAFHELGTNAVKFGALAGREGRVAIAWTVRALGPDDWLEVSWTETLPPGAGAARLDRRGFGLDLIETGLAYQLDAVTRVGVAGGGLRCTIAFPLKSQRPRLAAVGDAVEYSI